MARINKKSRIKGLPPKLLLQTKDALTGSYPGKFRTASDGKNGRFNIFFDDMKTVNFVTGAISLGTGVSVHSFPSGSHFNVSGAYNSAYVELGQDMSSSLTASGSIRKGVADAYLSFNNPLADSFEPFKEHTHVDTKTRHNDTFYATGSSINEMAGQDFTSPLWSKTKITIDLTPKIEHSVAIRNFTSGTRNHPMMYWNNDLKVWEGIGTGKEFSHADYFYAYGNTSNAVVTGAYTRFLDEQTIGFANGYYNSFGNRQDADTVGSFLSKNAGVPIDNFLFPTHNKFSATGSNLINMSNYIDEPFVLEKIILEISCTFNGNRALGSWIAANHPNAFSPFGRPANVVCNFFILNQFDGKKESYVRNTIVHSGSNTTTVSITSNTNSSYNFSTRELITWADIVYVPVEGNTDNLIQDEYVRTVSIDPSTKHGTYYDRSNINFVTYAGSTIGAQQLAASVLGAAGREVKFGEIPGFSTATEVSDYASAHPEFDSIFGFDGTVSGQSITNNSSIAYPQWSGKIIVSMSCKSPIKKNNTGNFTLWDYSFKAGTITTPKKSSSGIMLGNNNAGRSFSNKSFGRDFKNTIKDADASTYAPNSLSSKITFTHNTDSGSPPLTNGVTQSLNGYTKQNITNPYLLLPTDKLIFGWQLPIHSVGCISEIPDLPTLHANFSHTLGPQLTFNPTLSKITLYGSYIKEGVEYHDTLEQHLTSENIHEVIE